MAIVVAIANRKGGVGKTTIATTLGAGLATRGKNVLIIDTDPQGQASTAFGIANSAGLFRLLVDDVKWEDVAIPVDAAAYSTADLPSQGRLFVVPSDDKTSAIPILAKNPNKLLHRIRQIKGMFDFIILDTAPTVTMLDGSVYIAADAFLYVTECETWSVDGLVRGIEQIREFDEDRAERGMAPIHMLGIIPNKVRDTKNHKSIHMEIKKAWGQTVWTPIPQRTVFSEQTKFDSSIFAFAPSSDEAAVMWRVINRFEKEVETWTNNPVAVPNDPT